MNVSKYWRHDFRQRCSIEAETEELDERAWRWREAVIAVAGELVGWPVDDAGEPTWECEEPWDWEDAVDALDRYHMELRKGRDWNWADDVVVAEINLALARFADAGEEDICGRAGGERVAADIREGEAVRGCPVLARA